jgi:hypothetical protein
MDGTWAKDYDYAGKPGQSHRHLSGNTESFVRFHQNEQLKPNPALLATSETLPRIEP